MITALRMMSVLTPFTSVSCMFYRQNGQPNIQNHFEKEQ
jgi:hypothetical protein